MTDIEIKKLWIGDSVYVISMEKFGIFEGIGQAGKVKIKFKGEYIFIPSEELELREQKEKQIKVSSKIEADECIILEEAIHFSPIIDLHMEALDPKLKKHEVTQILSYQVRKCKEFIEKAISLKQRSITIIHGKGNGVLRSAVRSLLQKFENQITFADSTDEGACHCKIHDN